jgi:hypothetical protein
LAVWREIDSIREDLASFPREAPPTWFKQDVDDLKMKMDNLTERLVRIEQQLEHLNERNP